MTLTLYHCRDARSLRPLWVLEELGLDYALVAMEFPPRLRHEGYLDINPLGTVPTLLDGELRLTESVGICQYLVQRFGPHPLAVAADEPGYGDWLNWLHRSDATLTFPLTLILRYGRYEPPERRLAQVVDDYTQWFLSRLRSVEAGLQGREHLCAGRFTAADICVGYAVYLARLLGLGYKFGPATAAWLERITARPAFLRCLERQAHLEPALEARDGPPAPGSKP